jgi:ribosomal protein S18 acetylase RimI-like enzyme
MRPYIDEDLEQLIAIVRDHLELDVTRHIGDWKESAAMLREAIPRARDGVHVIEIAGEIAGFVWVERHDDWLYLEELHVIKSARGAGLGRTLMEHVECAALQRGHSEIRLSVFSDSPAAIFYRRLGFEIVGEAPQRNQLHLRKAVQ